MALTDWLFEFGRNESDLPRMITEEVIAAKLGFPDMYVVDKITAPNIKDDIMSLCAVYANSFAKKYLQDVPQMTAEKIKANVRI